MDSTRTERSIKNLVVGLVLQVFSMFLSFAHRTIFIHLLGEQYLGINGLYSNILQLLSLADLGMTTAFVFALYKPLANKDYDTLAAYLYYFKKVFTIIAVVIFAIGLLVLPLLPYIVNGSALSLSQLRYYFILSVANISMSYLAVYKSSVIKADQKEYIIKIVATLTTILTYILQIVLLYLTKNYYFYLISAIVVTLLNNILLTIIVNKQYPDLAKRKSRLGKGDKSNLLKNVFSVALYKVGAVIINSTDNILVSVLLGTIIVGYYSNYALIISILTTFIGVISSALLGSIGNLGTEENKGKLKRLFHVCFLGYHFIGAFCAAACICIFNDFILLWLGDPQYIISQKDVILIVFSFYVACISNPLWMFRESIGLFSKIKYIMLICAGFNIGLSILFAQFWGLGGIIFATGVSRLITIFWYEPRYLYKLAFGSNYWEFWGRVLFNAVPAALSIIISYILCGLLPGSNILWLGLKIAICGASTLMFFALFNLRSKEGNYIFSLTKKLFHKK